MNDLKHRYFTWMCRMIDAPERYSSLLLYLNNRTFTYLMAMDSNRYEDGIDLRYTFGFENDISDDVISEEIDDHPCSVLEMMVALAHRCEVQIMEDDEIGDRTGEWFWEMIRSLGLNRMTDRQYDEEEVDYIVSRFLQRDYEENGEGGLFTLRHPPKDLRYVEIWYQAMWYLESELIKR